MSVFDQLIFISCSSSIMLTESVMLLAVADVLTDAASVLGGDATLQILYKKLLEVHVIIIILDSQIVFSIFTTEDLNFVKFGTDFKSKS